MKIGVVTEPPFNKTGFGRVADAVCTELTRIGHKVSCFSRGYSGSVDTSSIPYRCFFGNGAVADDLFKFVATEAPESILFLGAIVYLQTPVGHYLANVAEVLPVAVHILSDGLPVQTQYVDILRRFPSVMTATSALSIELAERYGIPSIPIPYGLDHSVFHPMAIDTKCERRRAIGLQGCYLVGGFGRNDERKQHPRTLEAIRMFDDRYSTERIRLYLHCQQSDAPFLRGWNLREVVARLNLQDNVIFPTSFDQLVGVPECRVDASSEPSCIPTSLDALPYNDRIAICDAIVNPAFAGGFELGTLEAQASGIPVAITDDGGNMAEVAGNNSVLFPARKGIWWNGADQCFVDPAVIVDFLARVRFDNSFRETVIAAGLLNAQKYSWLLTAKRISMVLDDIVRRAVLKDD